MAIKMQMNQQEKRLQLLTDLKVLPIRRNRRQAVNHMELLMMMDSSLWNRKKKTFRRKKKTKTAKSLKNQQTREFSVKSARFDFRRKLAHLELIDCAK